MRNTDVLAGVDNSIQVSGMSVSNWVRVGIPSTEAHVKTAHEGECAINDAELLVMCPVEDNIASRSIEGLQSVARDLVKGCST